MSEKDLIRRSPNSVMKKPNKNQVEALALERIYRLFELVEEEKNPGRAKRYVELARKISARNKARIPAELKKRFCKKCGSPRVKAAAEESWVRVKCLDCGKERKARK